MTITRSSPRTLMAALAFMILSVVAVQTAGSRDPGRCGPRLEPARVERAVQRADRIAAGCRHGAARVPAPRDGAGRGLRRRERDRRRLSAVSPRPARRLTDRFDRRRGGDGGPRRARRAHEPGDRRAAAAPGHARLARRRAPDLARGGPRRGLQGRRDRDRGAAAEGDAGCARGRRPFRAVLVHRGDRCGRVAPDATRIRQRPVRLDLQRRSVHAREHLAVPHRRAERAHERGRTRPSTTRSRGSVRSPAPAEPPSRRPSPCSTSRTRSSC